MKKETFIHSPVPLPVVLHQNFGENRACIHKLRGNTITCDGLNPPSGYKSIYSMMDGHNGLDIGAKSWQPCYNAQKGTVVEVSTESARGLGVGVLTEDKYWCNETNSFEHFVIRYWHFWANEVEVGQTVKTGALLGYCGSTGYSSGVHLHLEVKPVKVRLRDGKYSSHTNILQDNGFFGAVDPAQYLTQYNALDFGGAWNKLKEMSALVADLLADNLRK